MNDERVRVREAVEIAQLSPLARSRDENDLVKNQQECSESI